MAATETALVQQMDNYILDGKYREATDAYCGLTSMWCRNVDGG